MVKAKFWSWSSGQAKNRGQLKNSQSLPRRSMGVVKLLFDSQEQEYISTANVLLSRVKAKFSVQSTGQA